MRLSTFQVKVIKNTLGQVFGQSAQIYLFGSRVDDQKKGGDIDLFVDTKENIPYQEFLSKTLHAVGLIQRQIGEQKIDLVVSDGSLQQESLPVIQLARQTGVLL